MKPYGVLQKWLTHVLWDSAKEQISSAPIFLISLLKHILRSVTKVRIFMSIKLLYIKNNKNITDKNILAKPDILNKSILTKITH
ncbi:hypothetical protein PUN28_010365 [Cardiocondyla obscurior]|uniref:Uncharacterized protein n=1 Tax=Cardiocondyla obscurior TaxID=286306 RepID=A0AAW2FRT6_9HYME